MSAATASPPPKDNIVRRPDGSPIDVVDAGRNLKAIEDCD